ncbi:MAG: heat-inducible transcription repressor HrcA, partial [Chitinivibrionales bacterium]|nr:heat-inducible transcription repressor HrcA [Chitinivibrionales bacterium]MBD3396153.1 heat-inducible transcription repressor HrcA [Chitinivibrionales bacterium]
MEEFLSPRETEILEEIVRNYVLSASPTGSRFIAKRKDFRYSAATIRNVMGDLEERGYITHPHTSAGRIPTDKGYRYYV